MNSKHTSNCVCMGVKNNVGNPWELIIIQMVREDWQFVRRHNGFRVRYVFQCNKENNKIMEVLFGSPTKYSLQPNHLELTFESCGVKLYIPHPSLSTNSSLHWNLNPYVHNLV